MKDKNQLAEITVSYRPAISTKPVVKSAFDAFIALQEFFDEDTLALKEQAVVLYLNRSSRVIGGYKLATGGIAGTVVDVRLILSAALATAATSFILAHNHPSGSLQPSKADVEMTTRVKEAARIMDIVMQDHIIISPYRQYYSFADEGLM